LVERLRVTVRVDHDLIAEVVAESIGRGAKSQAQIHDLEFGLPLTDGAGGTAKEGQ
jgi:hypothetical protein